MYEVKGSCHCKNIEYIAVLQKEPSSYVPRACDCKLCKAHGAQYISDSEGTLTIIIKENSEISRYQQGTKIADFLICKNCGVLTHVIYKEKNRIYGNINITSLDSQLGFAATKVAHLTELNNHDRIQRWKQIWFSNVNVVGG